jgi:hypothetical protein
MLFPGKVFKIKADEFWKRKGSSGRAVERG